MILIGCVDIEVATVALISREKKLFLNGTKFELFVEMRPKNKFNLSEEMKILNKKIDKNQW